MDPITAPETELFRCLYQRGITQETCRGVRPAAEAAGQAGSARYLVAEWTRCRRRVEGVGGPAEAVHAQGPLQADQSTLDARQEP